MGDIPKKTWSPVMTHWDARLKALRRGKERRPLRRDGPLERVPWYHIG